MAIKIQLVLINVVNERREFHMSPFGNKVSCHRCCPPAIVLLLLLLLVLVLVLVVAVIVFRRNLRTTVRASSPTFSRTTSLQCSWC